MKTKLPLVLAAFLISSCATMGPVGSWDYTVTGTPQGDYAGVMTVTKTEAGYSAKLSGQAGEITFDKFTFDRKTKKTGGDFFYSDTPIAFSAQVDKDQMKGLMSTGDMEFPFNATRKK